MLRLLIQNISEIVIVVDPQGMIRFSSPQLEKVLGLRAEDVAGRSIFDFIHPDDVRRTSLEYAQTVQVPGEHVPSALRIREAGGEWIPFEIVANNQIDNPDIRGVIFTARDLRYRQEVEETIRFANADVEKRVEERTIELARANAALRLENQSRCETQRRLQESNSLLSATLDATGDGILVISTRGKITGCNQRFLKMWHFDFDSVAGRDDTELLSAAAGQLQNGDEFMAKVQILNSDPGTSSFDVLRFKDGRIYERYSQPQRLDDGIVGRVWSFRDVTEARRLEEELRHSQKIEALGRLAGGVAHDFNNLLMLISGYLEQLSACPFLPKQREAYEQARAATKRSATLTRQLLAFSRKHREAPTVTDLNVVVANMQGILRALVSDGVRLDVSLDDYPVPVLADAVQLEVVLMNLVINAHDAMPDGGVLSVATGKQDEQSRMFALLSVTDTGRGMSREVQARIFKPFFTTKQVGKGTGLGLSIVSEIVQRIGGHIEFDSALHRGTQFRVYLPETKALPETSIDIGSPVPPEKGYETILLAEDEAGIRAMTKAYLETLGYRVLEAADGSEAVRVAREHQGPIHLVLSDVLMPNLRGDAAVSSIRESRPDVKALYISGYSEDIVTDESTEVLLKPFEFPELGRRVRSLLDVALKLDKPA